MTAARDKAKTTKSQAGEDTAPIPLRFGDDPQLWAAWLYYEEG